MKLLIVTREPSINLSDCSPFYVLVDVGSLHSGHESGTPSPFVQTFRATTESYQFVRTVSSSTCPIIASFFYLCITDRSRIALVVPTDDWSISESHLTSLSIGLCRYNTIRMRATQLFRLVVSGPGISTALSIRAASVHCFPEFETIHLVPIVAKQWSFLVSHHL